LSLYIVTFTQQYRVEADDEGEAISEAESRLARNFEQPHIGLSEVMGEPTVQIVKE